MSQAFIGYNHVYKYDKEDVEGYLNEHKIFVEVKIDGSNSSIYYDGNNEEFVVQSRKRVINLENDNGGFAKYILTSDDNVATAVRNFCIEHPYTCVYGEWIGGLDKSKFLGTIKYYLHGGFFVFDIRDINHKFDDEFVAGHYGYYTPEDDIYKELAAKLIDEDGFSHMAPVIAILDQPSLDDIIKLAQDCHWNVPEDKNIEGVVLKSYTYKDKYQHHQFAKVILKEYLESKHAKDKSYKSPPPEGDVEKNILDEVMNDAKMEKTKNKVEIALGDWKDDNKHIPFFLNLLWHDVIEEDLTVKLLKRYKNPKIDFSILKGDVFYRGRHFLGLI